MLKINDYQNNTIFLINFKYDAYIKEPMYLLLSLCKENCYHQLLLLHIYIILKK